jgi:hypothetical protein
MLDIIVADHGNGSVARMDITLGTRPGEKAFQPIPTRSHSGCGLVAPLNRLLLMFSAAVLLAILSGMAHAKTTPLPQPKPKPAATAVKPKPAPTAPPEPAPPPNPRAAAPKPPAESPPPVPPQPSPAELYQDCQTQLRSAGVEFEALDKITDGRCTVETAVALISVSTPSGKVELPGHPRTLCAFGLKFGRWIGETAAPIIAAHAGAALTAIDTGPGFECRTRNGENSGKLSEHARGNAVDVVSFDLADRRRITVGDTGLDEQLAIALKGLRTSACGYFTTVLGPGSNEAHKNHLHFDLALHGKSDNYRICE